MIKAIIFDLDDTLLMTRETKYAAHIYFGKSKYNIDLTPADISLSWGKPLKQLMIDLYGQYDTIENILQGYESIRHHYPNKPYADSIETVNTLAERYPIGILSSSNRSLLLSSLTESGFSPRTFFYIQSEEDTDKHKPNPEVFNPLLKQLTHRQTHASQTVYIGDSLLDYSAAVEAGLEFYGVADRTTPKTEFEKAGAKTIKNLSELLRIL